MCSIPRFSAMPRSIHRLSANTCSYQSYSQMMKNSTQRYEQRQQEVAKKRTELAQKENKEMVSEEQDTMSQDNKDINEDTIIALEKSEAGFFKRLLLRLSHFISRKPTRIYHEHR